MSLISHLFPGARAELLRLLFDVSGKELHVRDIARLAALSPGAVQKELLNLSQCDLLMSRRDGNRLYYRANVSHPVYRDLHQLVIKTVGIVGELQRAIRPVSGIEMAFIFGSIAAGTDTANSDVDLLFIGSAGLRQIAPALQNASGIEREINPNCMTADEWTKKRKSGDTFVCRVDEEPKLWLKGGADELRKLG